MLENVDLVILAGGKGTRIKKFLGKYPKPMLKINKKPFIQYILNNSVKYNFKRIIILCGYRYKFFHEKFHNTKINFTKIICLREKKLLGTAGALVNLKKLKVKDFVLVNGDTIFDIDINLLFYNLKKNKLGIIALTKNNNQKSLKLNNLNLKNNKLRIEKKSKLMNGGVYFFKKEIFKYIERKNSSLENDLLPKLIRNNKIDGKFFNNFFIDIGSKFYLKKAQTIFKKKFKKPGVFLDRDGVINHDYGYVHKMKNFKLKLGVVNGLRYLIKKNYYIFLVTNQAGIGKGFFTENQFINFHKKINKKLRRYNVYFNDVRYSPFHKKAKIKKYRKNSSTRKPGNKMIKDIKLNWDLDLKKSFMIGDKMTDKLAAKKSGIKFFYAKNDFCKLVKSVVNNN